MKSTVAVSSSFPYARMVGGALEMRGRLSSSVKDLTEDRAPKFTESFLLRTLDLTPSIEPCLGGIGKIEPRPARPPPGGQPDQPVGFLSEVSSRGP